MAGKRLMHSEYREYGRLLGPLRDQRDARYNNEGL